MCSATSPRMIRMRPSGCSCSRTQQIQPTHKTKHLFDCSLCMDVSYYDVGVVECDREGPLHVYSSDHL